MSKLDLQLWLQEQELGAAFPILVNEGYTSRNQLYAMDLEKVLQVECIYSAALFHLFHMAIGFLSPYNAITDSSLIYDIVYSDNCRM